MGGAETLALVNLQTLLATPQVSKTATQDGRADVPVT
jgi:hypothetical protein